MADASVHPFPPDSFELTFSRFGIMFFSDPVAAFANVRRAMKPGGRLTLAVFRPASEKLWPNAPLEAVRHLLPPIPTPGPEEPGPFSWADPARVHRRVLPSLSAAQRENVRATLEVYFKGHATSQGVILPAANWVARARV